MALKTAKPPAPAVIKDKIGARIPRKMINHIKSGLVLEFWAGPLTITAAVNMAIILKDILAIPREKKPVNHAKTGFPATGNNEPPTANGPNAAINSIVASIKF